MIGAGLSFGCASILLFNPTEVDSDDKNHSEILTLPGPKSPTNPKSSELKLSDNPRPESAKRESPGVETTEINQPLIDPQEDRLWLPEPRKEKTGEKQEQDFTEPTAIKQSRKIYSASDVRLLLQRYGISPEIPHQLRETRWNCWIADPTCGLAFEVSATSAYAWRVRQRSTQNTVQADIWHSALAIYEVSLLIATNTQAVGRFKYNVFSLGPVGGIAASDHHDLWGSFGLAARYWLGRKVWSPALELHGQLNFKMRGEDKVKIGVQRSPMGFRGDFGVNFGGWASLILGGEYQVPLVRDGVPEQFHIPAGGMVYLGIRGNILWGLPAATAVGTHILVNQFSPDRN